MGAKRKYPLWPGRNDDEVPYDTEHLKRWLVNAQGATISTATSYVSSIRTAFSTLFAEDDALFKNLRNAFISRNIIYPEKRVARLEDEYETLEAYLWAINEFGDVTLDEFNSNLKAGQSKEAPKKMWVTAFQTYIRYIRLRIDNERAYFGFRITIEDNNKLFLEMPLSRQYRLYLANLGSGYTSSSINVYCNKLRRLYNLLFRRRLKIGTHPVFYHGYIAKGTDVWPLCDKLMEIFIEECENLRFDDLSIDDLLRGWYALLQYCHFLKDYAENPEKYPREIYEIEYPHED